MVPVSEYVSDHSSDFIVLLTFSGGFDFKKTIVNCAKYEIERIRHFILSSWMTFASVIISVLLS